MKKLKVDIEEIGSLMEMGEAGDRYHLDLATGETVIIPSELAYGGSGHRPRRPDVPALLPSTPAHLEGDLGEPSGPGVLKTGRVVIPIVFRVTGDLPGLPGP